MSPVTRCAACATVFRFDPERVSASDGKVRCGRCGEVFDAVRHQVELDGSIEVGATVRPAAPPATPPAARPTALSTRSAVVHTGRVALEPAVDVAKESPVAQPVEMASLATVRNIPADPNPATAAPQPSFLRERKRPSPATSPSARRALTAGVGLGAVLAVLQIVHIWHDDIGARWPGAQSAVSLACVLARCDVGAPRRIHSLAVESSGLQRDDSADSYRLSVVIRNRDPLLSVRIPWLDLVVTDALGNVVARRALEPAALGVDADRIAPSSELAMAATLQSRDTAIVGYTIDLFYP